MSPDVILVVPCFNEARRLDLPAFQHFLEATPGAQCLFVDDGSTDATAEILSAFCAAQPARAVLLRMPHNVGKAEAVRRGLRQALESAAPVVGFWDADLATPLEAVADFLGVLRRQPTVDWVIGARVQLLGRVIRRRAARHYAGRVFATAASLVLDLPVYDTQCGAKLFRASPALRQLLERPFVSTWIFDVEMIARLMQLRRRAGLPGCGIYELPLNQWVDVDGSKVRTRDFVRASFDLLAIWRDARRPAGPDAAAADPVGPPRVLAPAPAQQPMRAVDTTKLSR